MHDKINLEKCYEADLSTHILPLGRAVAIQDEGKEGIAIGTLHGNEILPRQKDIEVLESKISDIKTPIESVNNKTGKVELAASDIKMDNGKTIEERITTHEADYVAQPARGTASSSNNAYTFTSNPAPTSYVDFIGFVLKADANSTGACTVNWNGLGAKALKKANGNDVTLKSGGIYTFRYNATTGNFILQGEGGEYGTVTADKVLTGYNYGTENGLASGTMPNNGATNVTQTSSGQITTIPAGYTSGGQVTNNITIASLGGKRYANGSITVAAPVSFTSISGSSVSGNVVNVTGLTFRPYCVVLKAGGGITIYQDSSFEFANAIKMIASTVGASTSPQCYSLKGDVSPANVYNGGFYLPTSNLGTCTWEAYG